MAVINPILSSLRTDLKNQGNEQAKAAIQRFFKEEIRTYGVKTPLAHKISKKYYEQVRHLTKAEIFGLCETLWQSGYIEESMVACNWSYGFRKQYEPGDFKVFEKWISHYVSNWASCDTLCNHTVGEFVEMYPEFLENLKGFTGSDNRWMRRAAAVSLIIPARNGKFLKDILEIADKLLLDQDDMVQKGYGWMLKSASQAHQQEVFDYVMKHKSVMPRTALRYAIEKLPKEMKAKAMEK